MLVNSKSVKKANEIIVACCVLHNLCLREGDSFPCDLKDLPEGENHDDDK